MPICSGEVSYTCLFSLKFRPVQVVQFGVVTNKTHAQNFLWSQHLHTLPRPFVLRNITQIELVLISSCGTAGWRIKMIRTAMELSNFFAISNTRNALLNHVIDSDK